MKLYMILVKKCIFHRKNAYQIFKWSDFGPESIFWICASPFHLTSHASPFASPIIFKPPALKLWKKHHFWPGHRYLAGPTAPCIPFLHPLFPDSKSSRGPLHFEYPSCTPKMISLGCAYAFPKNELDPVLCWFFLQNRFVSALQIEMRMSKPQLRPRLQ